MFDMRRREFIALLGGAAAALPLAARAQQDRVRRIGVLMAFPDSDSDGQSRLQAFRQELERLGWTVGRNLQIDYRWGADERERAQTATAELLRLAPDVILAQSRPAVAVLQQATRTIPIVFVGVAEPVVQGFVAGLAHPGGNLTGFTQMEPAMGGKWLELLKEIAPGVTRVAIMFNPKTSPFAELSSVSAEAAARKFSMEATVAPVHEPAQIEAVMTMLGREPGGGLILPADIFTYVHRKLIIELAARYRLPAIYGFRVFAAEGGLVSYGNNPADQFRPAAGYVHRILRGEKPADLPVVQPTKFELVINLKTAKALGLDVPLFFQQRADEVIE